MIYITFFIIYMSKKNILIILVFSFLLFNKVFAELFFSELMPNTIDDTNLEYINIYNSWSSVINLEWYYIKDKSWKQFDFGYWEYLWAFETRKITRVESKIILNNSSEEIFLYNNYWTLLNNFSYSLSIKWEKIIILNDENNESDTINNEWSNQEEQEEENNEVNFNNFEIKYNFQNPSYLLEKDTIKDKYICDNTKDECKINLDLRDSFDDEYIEWNFNCEIDFWLSWWINWEEYKCNPNTIIYPVWIFNLQFQIISKIDNTKIFTKNISIENNIKLEVIEKEIIVENIVEKIVEKEIIIEKIVEKEIIVEKEVCNNSSNTNTKYVYNNDNSNIDKIIINVLKRIVKLI